jgi:hypothetical protein
MDAGIGSLLRLLHQNSVLVLFLAWNRGQGGVSRVGKRVSDVVVHVSALYQKWYYSVAWQSFDVVKMDRE